MRRSSGTASRSVSSSRSTTACASPRAMSRGSFTWRLSSGPPSSCRTRTLWTSRTPGTPSAAAVARSRRSPSTARGSTWTRTSESGQLARGSPPRSRRRSCAPGRAPASALMATTRSTKSRPRGVARAQPAELEVAELLERARGPPPRRRRPRGPSGPRSTGGPAGRRRRGRARRRSAPRSRPRAARPRRRATRPTRTASEPAEVRGEVQRVGRQRRRVVAAGGAAADDRARGVDADDDARGRGTPTRSSSRGAASPTAAGRRPGTRGTPTRA